MSKMSKYIEQDKAIDKLRRRKALFCKNQIEFKLLPTNDKSRVDEIDACIAMLINMPPEDVQPVVRCGECAYFRAHRGQSDFCVMLSATVDDIYGFCSKGKRKGADE